MPDCDDCPHPEELQPRNLLAFRLYELVSDQVRPALMGPAPLDLAAVVDIANALDLWGGMDPLEMLSKVKAIHSEVIRAAEDNGQ